MRGRAMLMSRSRNSYMRRPRSVTLQPMALPSRSRKPLTAFLALVTKAKKAVSGFRLREGNAIGCKVTLRGRRMYEFLDRLISIALPRIRDFRGVNPKSFDGHGNYRLGLTEQSVFPEIDPDKVNFSQGMDVTFVTSTNSDDEARELLRGFGMPSREAYPEPAACGLA